MLIALVIVDVALNGTELELLAAGARLLLASPIYIIAYGKSSNAKWAGVIFLVVLIAVMAASVLWAMSGLSHSEIESHSPLLAHLCS